VEPLRGLYQRVLIPSASEKRGAAVRRSPWRACQRRGRGGYSHAIFDFQARRGYCREGLEL
jgi:hypothetical protein